MKPFYISILTLIILFNTAPLIGQYSFRLMDPDLPGARYGNDLHDGPPFLYFNSTSQQYHLDHAGYSGYEDQVEAGFTSWNNVGPVQFSESSSGGVQVTGDAQNPSSWGPAWMFPAFNGTTYAIDASATILVLNTVYGWTNHTHRIHTLRNTDRVYILENSTIEGSGTIRELQTYDNMYSCVLKDITQ